MRLAFLIALAASTPALAEPDAPAEPPATTATATAVQTSEKALLSGDRWTIRIQPRAWYVAPSGDVRLKGSSNEVDVRDLDLDEPTIEPYGEASVQAGNFLFTFSGGTVSTDSKGRAGGGGFTLGDVSVAGGDRFDASLDFTTFNLTAGYKVWQHVFEGGSPGANVLRVWAIGGARVNDLDLHISSGGTSSSGSETWVDVIGGARLELQVLEQLSADMEFTLGGLSNSFSSDVAISLTWRPVDWFGAHIGYRILFMDFEDGSGSSRTSYNGSMAGLFFGATVRF